MQKDWSLCKYVHFAQHICTNTVWVIFAQNFFLIKREVKQRSLSAIHLKASPGPQLNCLIPKSYSCPAVMWQKEHHSRSAVLLSSLKTLPSSQHTTWMYMYTHVSSLDTKFLHFFLTGPLMLSLSSYITHCPHFSIRAHFHFSHRHHQCPENPSFPITWAMVLKRMIQTSPRIYPA